MGDLSTHFSRKEFACRCGCGFDTADYELVEVLEDVRQLFKQPITITGPNRCPARNAETPGASPGSKHQFGIAVDFKVRTVSPEDVYDYLDRRFPNRFGLGIYNNRVHLDVRPTRARWDKRY